mmetsp:Transcript_51109/g.81714  ORF Transcript_51109/g.81714 Transcript_51109/m.81714 type:complete len:227 (-) Transcript_51109:269-949(-)
MQEFLGVRQRSHHHERHPCQCARPFHGGRRAAWEPHAPVGTRLPFLKRVDSGGRCFPAENCWCSGPTDVAAPAPASCSVAADPTTAGVVVEAAVAAFGSAVASAVAAVVAVVAPAAAAAAASSAPPTSAALEARLPAPAPALEGASPAPGGVGAPASSPPAGLEASWYPRVGSPLRSGQSCTWTPGHNGPSVRICKAWSYEMCLSLAAHPCYEHRSSFYPRTDLSG